MRVVICGAGQVGTTIARHLVERGDHVTVIDASSERTRRMGESYDVRAIQGHASHPEVLRRAGAQDADMLIAVTRSDDVNMVACQMAYSLFGVKRRLARLRHAGFLERDGSGLFAAEHMPIDVLIAPEIEIAESISRRLRTPGAFEMTPFADGKLALLGVHIADGRAPLVGERLWEMGDSPVSGLMVPVLVERKGRLFPYGYDTRVELGDDLYVIADASRLAEVQQAFGYRDRPARRIVIAGAGNVGLHLVSRLRSVLPGTDIKIIELDQARAEEVAIALGDNVLVLGGDVLEQDILDEAQIGLSDVIVSVTNDDETNIFAAVLAKQAGCKRAISLVEKPAYQRLIPGLGLDSVLNPSAVTIATVLRYLRGGAVIRSHALGNGYGELVEIEVKPGARADGALATVLESAEIRIAAVMRGPKLIRPEASLRLEAGDRVLLMVLQGHWPTAEQRFV